MLFLIHALPNHPSPLAYSVLILLVTSCFTLLFYFSLPCHHYFCCHHHFHITIGTNTSLPSKYLSCAVELTTQLSKLINILWLPLCRISKLGILPAKTIAIPYTCGSSASRSCYGLGQGTWDDRARGCHFPVGHGGRAAVRSRQQTQ